MPTARDILRDKKSDVYTIQPQACALDAIAKMNQHKIGALVVMQGDQVIGMFTERDVLRRVVGADRAPAEITVAEVMTGNVVFCEPSTELDAISQIMKERRIRHVPVCDGLGKLLGLISIGDVNATHASTQAQQINYLSEYIYGRA